MARKKKNKKGKSGKGKKKGGLFGWFAGKEEGEAPPPAQAPESAIPDDFNPERTFVPEYAQDSAPASGGFGDLPADAERTMAPGYSGGELPPGAEMTMAPGYAGGGGFGGELPPGAEMTMAPGYAGGGGFGGELPPGAEMTMAPGYAGGELPPGAEMTMAPGYAGGAGGDPFSFDAQRDLGNVQAKLAGLKPNQSLDELNPFLVPGGSPAGAGGAPGAPAGAPGAPASGLPAGTDPFGPPLLDDPYAGGVEGGDYVGERTMVDIPSDIEELADLKPTEELFAGEQLDLGGGPAVGAAPAAARGTRRMFQRVSYAEDAVVYADPDPEVNYDVTHGFVFAPAVSEGWSNVPPSLTVLSDGCVIGRGDLDGHGTLTASAPPQEDGDSLVFKLPASANYDPETRAVFVPLAAAGRISWRPLLSFASEDGVTYTLPKGAVVEGRTVRVPREGAADAGPHGPVVATHSYLGVRETVHADGWACLELPTDAELSAGMLALAADGAPPPPLLACSRLDDGRWQLELPMGSMEEGLSVWIPPAYPSAPVARFDPQLRSVAKVTDARTWAGVHDALLDDGWIELRLPVGSAVEGRKVLIPAPYAVTLTPELQFELTREDDGRLSFELPAHSEVLGERVLIPPAGYTPAPVKAAPHVAAPKTPKPPKPTGRPSVPTKAKAKDGGSETTHGSASKTAKALDRFRSGKADDAKVDDAKSDDAKADDAKADDAKVDDAKSDDAKADDAKAEDAKSDDAKVDDAKVDDAKADDAKAEDAKSDDAKSDDAKADEAKADEAKSDEAKSDDAKGPGTKRKGKKRSRGKSK